MDRILFTGFPGFLGTELLPRVLARAAGVEAVCLVQPKFVELAERRAGELTELHPDLAGRVRIVPGDIVAPDLGLGPAADDLARSLREIFHLAAVYDLSVGRELAMRVNVDGTRHVLALARRSKRLSRFQYVSTCYVSGRHAGRFSEDQLDVGQTFNNFYEETKFLAEVEVQQAMREGLPTSIYRPAVVVGDSTTGATQKYDGPYFMIQWLLRQPKIALVPVVGDPKRHEFNVVPRDFVVDAIAALCARADTVGGVFNLADPAPLTVDEIIELVTRVTRRIALRVKLPLGLVKGAVERVPLVDRVVRVPSAAFDYFVHPTRYGTATTQAALATSGIRCPRFPEYAERAVAFVRAHPEVGHHAMV
ncbi:MAG: SDR family oxidoreductase [bacterium]